MYINVEEVVGTLLVKRFLLDLLESAYCRDPWEKPTAGLGNLHHRRAVLGDSSRLQGPGAIHTGAHSEVHPPRGIPPH
jgi:hypothetical protein